ncbi:MAG: dihydrodipicolinate synthase family protein, partial [Bacteroidota bacterium]
MKINWKGVMPAVTTKFTSTDQLDLNMFAVNIYAQLEAGVHGIILGGTLGEASTLTNEEKRILVKETVKIVDGKIPVIINIAEQSTRAAIQAAQHAKEDGASGLMMLPPMRYKADSRETVTYFKAVAQTTDLPIMVYNNPVDYGIEVTLDMFEELLKDCPNIQAVKESTRDVSNITRIKNRFGDRLAILCGVDTLALESLLMGAEGWVAGLVCAFPAETVAIYALAKAEKIAEAVEIYRWFLPLLELDINTKLVQNIKLAEVATGIGTEYVREPRLPLIGAERANVLKIIEDG